MKQVIFGSQGYNDLICAWVKSRIHPDDSYNSPQAIGVVRDDTLIGGVVYDNYNGNSMEMSCAGDRDWLSRDLVRLFFEYPFVHCKCNRVTALVRDDNKRALNFDLKLGFQKEGFIRHAYADGTGVHVLGMLKSECKWIKEK